MTLRKIMPPDTNELAKSADRSTVLAADRTIFAAERSYAAWVQPYDL